MGITPWRGMMSKALANALKKLTEVLSSEDGEYDAQEQFQQVYLLHDYNAGDRKIATIECGSFGFKDTPKVLYRLLFLTRAKSVDFSDMYKSASLFALTSPDGQFVADIQFFKYELAAYISAPREHIEGRMYGIIAGAPGSDNGIRAKSPELKLWAETLRRCLDKSWMVYGGNDFEV
jgi:hypothetical protein